GQTDMVSLGLATAGLTALAFLIGQLIAWRQLTDDGYLLDSNPANSFFYLITAMHGLHILGGLVGLGRTSIGAWTGARPQRLRLGIELCAMYWHFLLFVWLGIFAVLCGWAATFVSICQRLLT
ncbi:MAG: cytochrome-c oxidase, partial [Mesorhizobium sp.]|uniref:cytochrome c oxidase subunit 3 n=1 Tax=Mesorhizobium sp. TaxID=1871066 RepID=UPI001229A453